MPIYQYLCPKCNLKFELKRSFSDESIVVCPKCQNGASRLFAPVPIIFKGSGFYATDNRKGVSEDAGKEDKKEDKSGAESAEK
ncbi:MAG: FmdB family transcriptional regulator [Chloroflexi bacterium]|nr:FmdB family transcriptional regulator [Chloroflexota bacterium]